MYAWGGGHVFCCYCCCCLLGLHSSQFLLQNKSEKYNSLFFAKCFFFLFAGVPGVMRFFFFLFITRFFTTLRISRKNKNGCKDVFDENKNGVLLWRKIELHKSLCGGCCYLACLCCLSTTPPPPLPCPAQPSRRQDFFCFYPAVALHRALFRVRAGNSVGWGPWSPSSDSLEAQDIILPAKRGATYMLMRWFNKPEGDVSQWELSRRVCGTGMNIMYMCVEALRSARV